MPTFKVRIFEVHSVEIEVQADTADGAKLAAKRLVDNGQYLDMGELEFSHVMDSAMWDVGRKDV